MCNTINKPFFSVIIPLYNKEAFIESTIQSVLQQTFQDFEIIIVDDGSTDKSHQIAARFSSQKIRLLKQKNQGVSVARNTGIETASGKYLALLDADDTWYTNHLAELKKQIDLFPNAGLYCNNYEVFYSETLCRKASFNFNYNTQCVIVPDYFKASITNPIAWTSAVGFSKEHFKKLGGFNTTYKTAQDLDLWIRFALQYQVCFNPTITMSYKIYIDDSLSKNEYNDIRYYFINSFFNEEKTNASLKMYLDVNRYAVALRCKIHNERGLYKKLKNQIDYKNLNWKQKIIINLPVNSVKLLLSVRGFFIKNKIYLTAYN